MTYVQTTDGKVFNLENTSPADKILSKKAGKAARKEYCLAKLRKLLKPGDTVYTVLRSRSSMSRVYDLYIIRDNKPRWISMYAADAAGFRLSETKEGIKIRGCGLDMGTHLVYCLSAALFPDGFGCIGKSCPSEDHRNGEGDYTPGHHHQDGEYALTREQL